jgi:hypothetical protein
LFPAAAVVGCQTAPVVPTIDNPEAYIDNGTMSSELSSICADEGISLETSKFSLYF